MEQHYFAKKVSPNDVPRAWAVVSEITDEDDHTTIDFYFSGLTEPAARNLASELNKMWNTIQELEWQLNSNNK